MIESAVIGHLMGDFVLQNDYIAQNKKKDTLVCAVHCAIWTVLVAITGQISHPMALIWLFATHFFIDRWQFIPWVMAFWGQKDFRDRLGPWSTILIDNIYHLMTIWIVFAMPRSTFAWIVAVAIVLNFFLYAMDSLESRVVESTSIEDPVAESGEVLRDRDD